ncbi:MAG: hypothetical protein ACYSWX_11140 [Planctomycetota bacterium]|jgi:hypothetical protein
MRCFSIALALTALTAVAPAAQQTVNVDFESGTLGWVGPFGSTGSSGITPSGGNGGGAGYRVDFSDFVITVRNSSNPAFQGDFSIFDTVTLSTDLKVDQVDFFFSPVSRPWLIELRDYDLAQGGYPWTSVWYKFADVSVATHGSWNTFSVTIDDPSSTSLPAGWRGYGAEDPSTFEPILPAGVTFADVIAGVDEIVYTTGEPGFFFGQSDFDLTLDNIRVSTTGGPWSDLGSGLAGANGEPKLFGTGTLEVGSQATLGLIGAAPGATAFLAVGSQRVDLPFFGGTLVPNGDVTIITNQVDASGTAPFGLLWPGGLASGTDLYWQYWVLDPTGPAGLSASNGLQSTTP